MNRDFKIGVAMGLCLIAAVSLWLAIQPSLSVKARMTEEPTSDQPPAIPQRSETAATSQSVPPAADTVQPKLRFHTVQRGDTLSGISKQYYGTTAKWRKILDANRNTLKSPDSLTPGMKLIIPD
jgi:nucleoid-associated protein YgaU